MMTSTKTDQKVITAIFLALTNLECRNVHARPVAREDEVSIHRSRNELFSVLDANGYRIEWGKGPKATKLMKGDEAVAQTFVN